VIGQRHKRSEQNHAASCSLRRLSSARTRWRKEAAAAAAAAAMIVQPFDEGRRNPKTELKKLYVIAE
jgi:hypothetical protein